MIRQDSISKTDVGKVFKVFDNDQELGYRKIREVFGIGFERRYEYYQYDLNNKKWDRVRQLVYCDCEGLQYEPIGRLEMLTLFGKVETGKVTMDDIRSEHERPTTKETSD